MQKLLSLIITLLLLHYSLNAQQKSDTIKTALLIVDIQNFYFPGEGPGLVNAEQASLNAKEVLQVFRDKNELVIHIRHKVSKGFDF